MQELVPSRGQPTAPALLYFDPASSASSLELSYSQLEQQQDAVARALLERGVCEGSLVADFCDEGPSLVVAILGILRAGAAVVPLDPTQPRARLVTLLDDCHPALAVCAESGRPALASRLACCLTGS